jgi:hypothetical protein
VNKLLGIGQIWIWVSSTKILLQMDKRNILSSQTAHYCSDNESLCAMNVIYA